MRATLRFYWLEDNMSTDSTFFTRLQEKIEHSQRIAVSCHTSPDGDALGSSLAIVAVLKQLWKNVDHRVPDEASETFAFMPYICTSQVGQIPANHSYDLIITTDTSWKNRSVLQDLSEQMIASDLCRFIDHHESNLRPKENLFNSPDTSSACELVANRLIQRQPELIDTDIATLLYTWMVTDTGNFRRWEHPASTHALVSRLHEFGADRKSVELGLYRSLNTDALQLIGLFLSRVTNHWSVYYSYLKKSELDEKNTDMRSLTSWSSLLYNLKNPDWVYCVMRLIDTDDDEQCIKISLRTSSDTINVTKKRHE
jgi:phosphoesterase RecJ-like protein